jgi:hypothetical protein
MPGRGRILLMLALAIVAPFLIAAGDVCDEECPPACGDCALCAHAAVVAGLDADPVESVAGAELPSGDGALAWAPARGVEHVPLRAG